jgi:hypothetical protein
MAAAVAGRGGEGLSAEGGPGSAGWRRGGEVEGERLLVKEGAGGPKYGEGGGAREPAGGAGRVLRKEGEGVGGTAIKEVQGATAAPAGAEESVA